MNIHNEKLNLKIEETICIHKYHTLSHICKNRNFFYIESMCELT